MTVCVESLDTTILPKPYVRLTEKHELDKCEVLFKFDKGLSQKLTFDRKKLFGFQFFISLDHCSALGKIHFSKFSVGQNYFGRKNIPIFFQKINFRNNFYSEVGKSGILLRFTFFGFFTHFYSFSLLKIMNKFRQHQNGTNSTKNRLIIIS